jgi:outer membrane protein OmpA-like peptidoglycan-associated protein
MKALLIALLLLSNSALFAQYNKYSGTLEGSLFSGDRFRLNSEDTIFFIQGENVSHATTRIGKFFLDFEFNLEEPFSIHFTNPYCVRKVAYFDLSDADTSILSSDDERVILFPKVNMDMVSNPKGAMLQLSVLNFNWENDQMMLDYQHADDQSELLDALMENPDSLFSDTLFAFDSRVLKVGDIYRPKENIRFAKKTGMIAEDSQNELDSMANFIIKNPNIIIEVGTHLDSRASENESDSLDKVRAERVKDYLISKGVDSTQLKSVGYWKYQPIASESRINSMGSRKEKEAAHKINDRTEFKIMSVSRRL